MKLNIKYLDNNICFDKGLVNCIELENKGYFYRIVNDFNNISIGNICDDMYFSDNLCKEINMENKIRMIYDYFNLDFNDKRVLNNLYKFVDSNVSDSDRLEFNKYYSKICKFYKKSIDNINVDLEINEDFNVDIISKLVNVRVKKCDSVLENLFCLIDLESMFNLDKLLVFVNLKLYLDKDELIELYKYSLYNNVNIILIDSVSYGVKLDYESKLIIDDNLDEINL